MTAIVTQLCTEGIQWELSFPEQAETRRSCECAWGQVLNKSASIYNQFAPVGLIKGMSGLWSSKYDQQEIVWDSERPNCCVEAEKQENCEMVKFKASCGRKREKVVCYIKLFSILRNIPSWFENALIQNHFVYIFIKFRS